MLRGKLFWFISITLVAVVGFVGCAKPASPTQAPPAATPKPIATPAPTLASASPTSAPLPVATAQPITTPTSKPEVSKYEAAKQEGKVMMYVGLVTDHWDHLKTKFEQKYPGIQADSWRSTDAQMYDRITTEARAGRYTVDAVHVSTVVGKRLRDEGYLGKYNSPEVENFPAIAKEPNGYWAYFMYTPYGIVYNKKLVSPDKLPKDLYGLLDPMWKGKLVMAHPTMNNMGFLFSSYLVELWGKEKAVDFFKKLKTQGPTMFPSALTVSTSINRGEFPLGLSYITHVLSVGGRDGVMDYVPLDPQPAELVPIALMKNAPHPNAGKLFLDFMLSEDGQGITASLGYPVPRRGVHSTLPGVEKLNVRSVPYLDGNEREEMTQLLKSIFQ